MFLSIFCLVQIPCELSVIILKEAVHDFLEANNELPEVISLLCDNNCLFDLALLDDVNNHLNHLYMKLQDMNKLFPNFKCHRCIQGEVKTANLVARKCGYEPVSAFKGAY